MKITKEITKQALPILVLTIFGEIGAGIILFRLDKFLSVLPGIIILIPVVMGMRGNILGIFASRLTSGLHLGLIEPRLFKNKALCENGFAILFLSVLIALLGGIISHYSCLFFGFNSPGIFKFVLIVLIASILADIILIFPTAIIANWSFKRGIDPDNIIMPIVTTLSDAISCFALVIAVLVIV